jgi:hypothetical protein
MHVPAPAHLNCFFQSTPSSTPKWNGSTVPEKKVRNETSRPSDSTLRTLAATSAPGCSDPAVGRKEAGRAGPARQFVGKARALHGCVRRHGISQQAEPLLPCPALTVPQPPSQRESRKAPAEAPSSFWLAGLLTAQPHHPHSLFLLELTAPLRNVKSTLSCED